jgi:diaminopimelate decarboxylase
MSQEIAYKNGRLFVEEVDVARLADAVGTPFYAYSATAISHAYARLRAAASHPRVKIFYAVKALSHIAILKVLGQAGAGMDVVSGGEIKRCLAAGIPAARMVFSGVGKSEDEITLALKEGIYQFNVESLPELEALSRLAVGMKRRAPVALRVNPDVDAGGHVKIITGKEENKFGINWDHAEEAYARASSLPGLEVQGLSVHIGSQILQLAPFRKTAERLEKMVRRLRAAGKKVERVSLGGGFGIPYQGGAFPLAEFGQLANEVAEKFQCDIELEPGRFLVGEAGILVTRTLYVKRGTAKNFLIVDAAMNDLIRPTLYEAYHPIGKVVEGGGGKERYDIVGPVCETGDYFAQNREIEACSAGDLIAIFCTGAYGTAMASTYNSRSLIAESLIKGHNFSVIRPALTIEQQLSWENTPAWL